MGAPGRPDEASAPTQHVTLAWTASTSSPSAMCRTSMAGGVTTFANGVRGGKVRRRARSASPARGRRRNRLRGHANPPRFRARWSGVSPLASSCEPVRRHRGRAQAQLQPAPGVRARCRLTRATAPEEEGRDSGLSVRPLTMGPRSCRRPQMVSATREVSAAETVCRHTAERTSHLARERRTGQSGSMPIPAAKEEP